MKIDKTTYKDRKERQIRITANDNNQPEKVFYFATVHFLFNLSLPTLEHFPLFSSSQADTKQNQSKLSQFLPPLYFQFHNSVNLSECF